MGEELRREPKHQGSALTEGRLLAWPEEGDSVVPVAATAAAIRCLRATGVSKENNTLLSETWQRLSTFPLQGQEEGGLCMDPMAGFPHVLPVGHDLFRSLTHPSSGQGWDGKTRHSGWVGSSKSLQLRFMSSNS